MSEKTQLTDDMREALIAAYGKARDLWSSQCFCFTTAPESMRRSAHEVARDGYRDVVNLLGPIVRPWLDAEYREAEAAARAAKNCDGDAMSDQTPPTHIRFEGWISRGGEFKYQSWARDWDGLLLLLSVPSIYRRKRIRVRTFYDRRLRRRVVQLLVGNGHGALAARLRLSTLTLHDTAHAPLLREAAAELDRLKAVEEQHQRLCLAELGGPAVWPCGCHVRILDHGSALLSGDGHEPCEHHERAAAALAERDALQGQIEGLPTWQVVTSDDDPRQKELAVRLADVLALLRSVGAPAD